MKIKDCTFAICLASALMLSACSDVPDNTADTAAESEASVTAESITETAAESAVPETTAAETTAEETSASETEAPEKDELTEFSIPQPEGEYISIYKDFLAQKLEEFGGDQDMEETDSLTEYRFELFDLDNDDTPELILSLGGFHAAGTEIFTVSGGNVISLGEFGSFGEIIVNEYNGSYIIDSNYSGMGVSHGVILNKNGDRMEQLISYSDEFYAADMYAANNPDEELESPYYINDESVSKEAFDSALSEYKSGMAYDLGRLMPLNSATISSGEFDNVLQKAEKTFADNGSIVTGVLKGSAASALVTANDGVSAVYTVKNDGTVKLVGHADGTRFVDGYSYCFISTEDSTDKVRTATVLTLNEKTGKPEVFSWAGDIEAGRDTAYCAGNNLGEIITDSFSGAEALVPYIFYSTMDNYFCKTDCEVKDASYLSELDTEGIVPDKDRIVSVISRSNRIINVNYEFSPDSRKPEDSISRTFINSYDGLVAYDINAPEQVAEYGIYPENMHYPDENGAMG